GQTAHLDLSKPVEPDVLRSAVNHHLRPAAISVLAAEPASEDFDARLSAIARVYLYRILNRRAPPALERGRVWHVSPPLDIAAMCEGAGISSIITTSQPSALRCARQSRRSKPSMRWHRTGDEKLCASSSANWA